MTTIDKPDLDSKVIKHPQPTQVGLNPPAVDVPPPIVQSSRTNPEEGEASKSVVAQP